MFSNLFEQNNLMYAYRYVNWDALILTQVSARKNARTRIYVPG
jgi:hypothetical protein